MTGLFIWMPQTRDEVWPTLGRMGSALQSHAGERFAAAEVDGIGVGVLDGVDPNRVDEWASPVMSDDGGHAMWLAGEIFDAGPDTPDRPQDAPAAPVRAALLRRLLARGAIALASVDGEFQIAVLDRRRRQMTLLTDRFGALPWYWARAHRGVAVACGVRGVLMAPGVSAAPDPDALRDATTFGGFRLGTRTNVASVRMLPGAVVATIADGALTSRRWWRWADLVERTGVTADEAIDGAHERWQRAVGRRLRGCRRPGQTLSGGFDSRAILAEAVPHTAGWTAITYGVPGCDDARFARAAADAAGSTWIFHALYREGWFEARHDHVQQTDGLIQLADLLHFESLSLQRAHLDTHFSGYIGDAVAGPTFNDVCTIEDALLAMPYYETPLSRGWHGALDRLAAETDDASWLPSRFAPFEHKLPQSTNRWSAAWRPWLRVRKPFTDYEFFDFCQTLPRSLRGEERFYERWLRQRYRSIFSIPAHKLGAPAAAPPWRVGLARATRAARRGWMATARHLHLAHRPWTRAYQDEHHAWSKPATRAAIEGMILRPASIAVAEWGRPAVAAFLRDWFDAGKGPTQALGALYTFEAYHAGLPGHLTAASARFASSRAPLTGAPASAAGSRAS